MTNETSSDRQRESAQHADARPTEGEYFYRDSGALSPDSYRAIMPCFVCGTTAESNYWMYYIRGITQCKESAKRVAAMFRPGSCVLHGLNSDDGNTYHIVVGVCRDHKDNAQQLCGLTEDGVITHERIREAIQRKISHKEFYGHVAQEAWSLWEKKHGERAQKDWRDAWPLCLKELGRIPAPAERKARAERLHAERSEAQAAEDWFTAEQKVAALYALSYE